MWLGVAHRSDHRETITGVGHVQVRDQHIEGFCSDKCQSVCHVGGGDYVKAFVFKCLRHHFANGVIVIHKQHSVRNEFLGRSHIAHPMSTNNGSMTQVHVFDMYNIDQLSRKVSICPIIGHSKSGHGLAAATYAMSVSNAILSYHRVAML